MHRERPLIVVILLWALAALLWLTPGILRPDGAGYYAYLNSTWFDHDLLFFDEWQQFGLIHNGVIWYQEITRTNHLGNLWVPGASVFWYPAFLLGDAFQRWLPGAGSYPRNGLSLPYNIATITASALAGLAALLIGYRLARRYASAENAGLSSAAIWFGTPLLWYSLRNSLMPHAPSALLTTAAVAVCVGVRERLTTSRVFLAGLLIGFTLAIRPQNLPLVVLPLFFIRREDVAAALRSSWAYAAGGIIGAFPQFATSWALYRSLLPVASSSGASVNWIWDSFSRFWFVETLLSWYHGAFTWSPILAVGSLGLVLLWKTDRRFALAGLYVFAVDWVANAIVDRAFWSGYSFGQRRFDNLTVFMIVGCAVVFARLPRWAAWAVALLSSLWTMSLFFAASSLDLNLYQTGGEVWDAFLRSMESFPRIFLPYAFVPSAFRGMTALLFVATVVVLAAMAAMIWRISRTGHWAAPAILGAYLACMASFYAYCGVNGQAEVPRYRELIARNRALGIRSGWVPAKLELLRREAEYERKSGRTELAAETESEIRRLSAAIASGSGR